MSDRELDELKEIQSVVFRQAAFIAAISRIVSIQYSIVGEGQRGSERDCPGVIIYPFFHKSRWRILSEVFQNAHAQSLIG